jgi:hypothetical protein
MEKAKARAGLRWRALGLGPGLTCFTRSGLRRPFSPYSIGLPPAVTVMASGVAIISAPCFGLRTGCLPGASLHRPRGAGCGLRRHAAVDTHGAGAQPPAIARSVTLTPVARPIWNWGLARQGCRQPAGPRRSATALKRQFQVIGSANSRAWHDLLSPAWPVPAQAGGGCLRARGGIPTRIADRFTPAAPFTSSAGVRPRGSGAGRLARRCSTAPANGLGARTAVPIPPWRSPGPHG